MEKIPSLSKMANKLTITPTLSTALRRASAQTQKTSDLNVGRTRLCVPDGDTFRK